MLGWSRDWGRRQGRTAHGTGGGAGTPARGRLLGPIPLPGGARFPRPESFSGPWVLWVPGSPAQDSAQPAILRVPEEAFYSCPRVGAAESWGGQGEVEARRLLFRLREDVCGKSDHILPSPSPRQKQELRGPCCLPVCSLPTAPGTRGFGDSLLKAGAAITAKCLIHAVVPSCLPFPGRPRGRSRRRLPLAPPQVHCLPSAAAVGLFTPSERRQPGAICKDLLWPRARVSRVGRSTGLDWRSLAEGLAVVYSPLSPTVNRLWSARNGEVVSPAGRSLISV